MPERLTATAGATARLTTGERLTTTAYLAAWRLVGLLPEGVAYLLFALIAAN